MVLGIDLKHSGVLVLVLGIDLGPLEVLVLVLTFYKLVLLTSDMQNIVVGCAFFNAKVFLTLIMFSFEFNFPSQINHLKNFRVKFFKEKTTLPYVVDELI